MGTKPVNYNGINFFLVICNPGSVETLVFVGISFLARQCLWCQYLKLATQTILFSSVALLGSYCIAQVTHRYTSI